MLPALPPGPRREAFQSLRDAAEAGTLEPEHLPALEAMLRAGLESGRLRALHSAHGEMAALRLYRRTPAGRALHTAAAAVTEALQALSGAHLDRIAVEAAGPSAHTLTLETDRGRILLRLDPTGARIQSVEVT